MKPLLIVDGYNVIGAWSEAEKKGWSLDESRDRLMRQLEDYAGFRARKSCWCSTATSLSARRRRKRNTAI